VKFMTEPELLDSILGLAIFFLPSITAFVLVTFSPLRRLRQPLKFFVFGFASGVIAALLSALAMARGTVSSRAFLFFVAVSILVGAVISLLASSETISEKRRDELVRKSGDQSWRVP
jgi:predicted membrane-bound spermidine synthase